MGHKYLKQLGVDKELLYWNWHEQKAWAKRFKLSKGVDPRECYNLDTTFYVWLYERLCAYLEVAECDLNHPLVEYKGEKYLQIEIITMLLERLRFYLTGSCDPMNEDEVAFVREIGEIWAAVLPFMWY